MGPVFLIEFEAHFKQRYQVGQRLGKLLIHEHTQEGDRWCHEDFTEYFVSGRLRDFLGSRGQLDCYTHDLVKDAVSFIMAGAKIIRTQPQRHSE